MSKYRKWVLTLGLMAVTPGISKAGPLDIFKPKRAAQSRSATTAENNQRIADNIAAALRTANISGYDIAIEQRNGTAVLTGKVAEETLRQRASQIVGRVPGVVRVDNQLEVVGPAAGLPVPDAGFGAPPIQPVDFEQPAELPADQGKPLSAAPADPFNAAPPATDNQAVAQSVADALVRSGLTGYELEVKYADGTALLAGTVQDVAQRAKAEQVASSVPGVGSVDNRLRVAGPPAGQLTPAAYQQGMPPQQMAQQQLVMQQMAMQQQMAQQQMAMAGQGDVPAPLGYGHPGAGAAYSVYNTPHLPEHAWPSYASYPNYSQVAYPQQYSASAWPYIGPFYPYPQVPLGWRQAQLEWDDGSWNLNFRPRTDKWWWFMNPKNW